MSRNIYVCCESCGNPISLAEFRALADYDQYSQDDGFIIHKECQKENDEVIAQTESLLLVLRKF